VPSDKLTSLKRPAKKTSSKRTSLPQGPAARREQWIPPERKLDLLGLGLVVLGVLTFLTYFAPGNEPLTSGWRRLFFALFGVGAWLVPLVFAVIGSYLILRHYRSALPWLGWDRWVGLVLLIINILIWAHAAVAANQGDIFPLAAAGKGGGYLGGSILSVLLIYLDTVGTYLVLLAWLAVAVLLTFRLSLPVVFSWLGDRLAALRILWGSLRARRGQKPETGQQTFVSEIPTADQFRQQTEIPVASRPISVAPGLEPATSPASSTLLDDLEDEEQPSVRLGVPEPPPPWQLPPIDEILNPGVTAVSSDASDRQRAQLIEDTLASFGAPAKTVEINRGPTITQFGVEPGFTDPRGGKTTRVKVSKITSLADDLALALAAPSIRIQAPVPGKGFIGIEVPNAEISLVALRDVMESEEFRKKKSPLRFALGKDVSGRPSVTDLATMPHLLIAGTTGSGKSVCVNAIITCFLMSNSPDDLRLLMVDPKRVELTTYNGIPHLLAPVVVELDRVVGALQWVTREMDSRYHKFAQAGVRNLEEYNRKIADQGEKKLPVWCVIIDELADLMLMAPDEVERILTRIAQLARATGIHMMIATQRPSVDVLTGLIKANFPARIAFAVASQIDSRVILDQPGAERLLGRGDMLFQSPDSPAPVRLQGAYVSESELVRLVQYWRQAYVTRQPVVPAAGDITEAKPGPIGSPFPTDVAAEQIPMFEKAEADNGEDALVDEAIRAVRQWRKASTTRLQRNFGIGYTRAARLMDVLEERGIIGPPTTGSQPREVIDFGDVSEEA
jgi:DNA segregation ATPase FtsK/SpoIIIE, S-DNA-T family